MWLTRCSQDVRISRSSASFYGILKRAPYKGIRSRGLPKDSLILPKGSSRLPGSKLGSSLRFPSSLALRHFQLKNLPIRLRHFFCSRDLVEKSTWTPIVCKIKCPSGHVWRLSAIVLRTFGIHGVLVLRYVRIHTHIHIYTCISIYTYICIHVYICVYVCIDVCMYVYLYTRLGNPTSSRYILYTFWARLLGLNLNAGRPPLGCRQIVSDGFLLCSPKAPKHPNMEYPQFAH